ncbi:hypothetical protein SpCBS45565_g08356 [Spizellomyces sp. 'palustris']|nr:hypothetical protein SpCBS45565_g08356 [Spizellomyces sp. 'palustris']
MALTDLITFKKKETEARTDVEVEVVASDEETQNAPLYKQLPLRELIITYLGLTSIQAVISLERNAFRPISPNVASDFDSLNYLSWLATTTFAVWLAIEPVWGKLSDLFGRKPPFMIAIVVYVLGLILCSVSPSWTAFIIFRAISSIGSGGINNAVNIIISDIVPLRHRGKYQSYYEVVFLGTNVLGPVMGAAFATNDKWRGNFYVSAACATFVGILLAWKLKLPSPFRSKQSSVARRVYGRLRRVDYIGTLMISVGAFAVACGLQLGNRKEFGWSSASVIALLCCGSLLSALFVVYEWKYAHEPLLPARLFRYRNVAVGFLLSFILMVGTSGHELYQTTFYQNIVNLTPFKVGLIEWAETIGQTLGGIVFGWAMALTGRYRPYLWFSIALVCCGVGMMVQINPDIPHALLVVQRAIFGIGFGAVSHVLLIAAQVAVEHVDIAVVTSMFFFFRALGGLLGNAMYGALYDFWVTQALQNRAPPNTPQSAIDAAKNSLRGGRTGGGRPGPTLDRSIVANAYADTARQIMWTEFGILVFALLVSLTVEHFPLPETLGRRGLKNHEEIFTETSCETKPGTEDESTPKPA